MTEHESIEEPILPPRETLDTWGVPELPDDFADRVVAAWAAGAPPVALARPRRWWAPAAAAVMGAAAAALIAWWIWPGSSPVEPGSQAPAARPFEPAVTRPAPGRDDVSIVVDVSPEDAHLRVREADRTVAEATGDLAATLPAPGAAGYTIEVEHPGYHPQSTGLTFEGRAAEVRIELVARTEAAPADAAGSADAAGPAAEADSTEVSPKTEAPPSREARGSATLRIGTEPGAAPARVEIDGKAVGTTPIARFDTVSGTHRVRWTWADGRSVDRTVTLDIDEVRTLKAE